MMQTKVSREQIIDFICEQAGGSEPSHKNEDVFGSLGIDGDDAFEFIESFGEKFLVNLDGYRWYFHHGEEGWGLGGVFFPPPNTRVDNIPITVDMLLESAKAGRWKLNYPPHVLPARRWDLHINQLVVFLLVGGLLTYLTLRYLL